MSRNCKPFMRLASAIKYKELLNDMANIRNYKSGVLSRFLVIPRGDEVLLNDFATKHLKSSDEATRKRILEVADEYDLYDKTIWDVYVRTKEIVKKYDFISLLVIPPSYNTELQKRYEKLVHQLLLFRKKYYNDLPDEIEAVVKS